MTALVVSNSANFGGLANQAIAELIDALAKLTRVNNAITLAGGYTSGGSFEITALTSVTNNFGVVASGTPGANGQTWAYAVSLLQPALATFLNTTYVGQINQLDQGNTVP